MLYPLFLTITLKLVLCDVTRGMMHLTTSDSWQDFVSARTSCFCLSFKHFKGRIKQHLQPRAANREANVLYSQGWDTFMYLDEWLCDVWIKSINKTDVKAAIRREPRNIYYSANLTTCREKVSARSVSTEPLGGSTISWDLRICLEPWEAGREENDGGW